MTKINLSRLKSTFETSSKIGETINGGLTRLPLSIEDKKMRDIFVKWLEDENLKVRIDDMGNIYGRRQGDNNDLGAIMMGSHLDTQPRGGRFDGIMGVLSSLEVIRTLNDYNIKTNRPIEIVNFTAEESGRFGVPMVGSGVLAKKYTKKFVYSLIDNDGLSFEESLNKIKYKGEEQNRLTNFNIEYYVEPHIEQSMSLEENNKSIGIVQGIEGVTNLKVIVHGQSSHSIYPITKRKDALLAASDMTLAIEKLQKEFNVNPYIGVFLVTPSKPTITARKVEFTFGIKHYEDKIRDKAIMSIEKKLHNIADSRGVSLDILPSWEMTSTRFSNEIIKLIETSVDKYNYSFKKMLSPAGHDARYMNDLLKSGMIFSPSYQGLSHCEEEYTSYSDIEKATNILFDVIKSLSNKPV